MSDCETKYVMIEARVGNIEKEVDSLKDEFRDHRKILTDNILILRENSVRLTTLIEKSDRQLEKQSEALTTIGHEVAILKQASIQPQQDNEEINWYRTMLAQNGKYFFILILVLLSIAFGVKLDDIISFLG